LGDRLYYQREKPEAISTADWEKQPAIEIAPTQTMSASADWEI
jgi:hypothetical protein